MSKVLVVDDEMDIRMLVRFYLEAAGHEVIEASTGEEGIRALTGGVSDLILLDLRLPDMEGWNVLRKWSTLPLDDKGRVVVMSAHASPSTLERAESEGASGYIVKPFRESDLLRWV
jgi:two-component system chemotaxis response regulator CheY